MKQDISEDYPSGFNNDTLFDLIKEYSKNATIAGRSRQYSTGPSYWKEMVELGQLEISNRIQNNLFLEIGKLKTEITTLKNDNRKSGKINAVLSFLTIFLALITGYLGYLTFDYSKSSSIADSIWKTSQIQLLKQNNIELLNIRNDINKFVDSAKEKKLNKVK